MSVFKRRDPSKLQQQLEQFTTKGFQDNDADVWKLTVDKAGNGTAVIRFLPGKTEDDLPFVKLVTHGFKNNGKWYIENCSSTFGDFETCPVCAYMNKNDTYKTNKSEYDLLKRGISYWANVLIVTDSANPDNVGKVMKYRFGKKIFDKIQAAAVGDESIGEKGFDAVCPFDGADFILKAKKVGEHLNYDDSKFKTPSPIPNIDNEEYAQSIMDAMIDINAIAAPDKFKSKEDLTAQFNKVMGSGTSQNAVSDFDKEMKAFEEESAPAKSTKQETVLQKSNDPVADSIDDAELEALLNS